MDDLIYHSLYQRGHICNKASSLLFKTEGKENAMCIRWYQRMGAALLLLPLLTCCVSAQAQEKGNGKDGNYSEILDRMNIPRNRLESGTKPVDISEWPKDSAVSGSPPERLKGKSAGLPLSALPGAKRISLSEVQQMDVDKQRTGLFLVDIDFVPLELPENMKLQGITLSRDGTLLDKNREPIVAFVTSEVYKLQGQYKTERTSDSSNKLFENVSYGHSPRAAFGNPFPFTCISFTPWALYHGGFYRWYEAETWASAYGPNSHGGCSSASPHTRIDYMQTRAAVGGGGNYRHCFSCEQEHSRDEWDIGGWWPAHGIPITAHSAIWADGQLSRTRTAFLTW